MDRSYLDYYKYILEKVSFDPNLFLKEYRKAQKALKKYEERMLQDWLHEKGLNVNMIPVKSTRQELK
jgi:hypothetical protein